MFAPLPSLGRTYVPSVPTKAKETFSRSPGTEPEVFFLAPPGGCDSEPGAGAEWSRPTPVAQPLSLHSCSLFS